jgi:superfamily II helicase
MNGRMQKIIYQFRICKECWEHYRFTERCGRQGGPAGDADPEYCDQCTEVYLRRTHRMQESPFEVVDLKRKIIAGKRILRRRYEQYQIELIKEISKTKDHESYRIAQSIIIYTKGFKKRQYRPTVSETNFQRFR